MLTPGKTYDQVYRSFQWAVPDFYNIGVDICDKWACETDRTALIYEDNKGQVTKYSFSDLKKLSNQLANGLKAHGIQRGDRVGILLGQSPETAISHIALYKIGAVAIPLFTLFGTDALDYRLSNSGARGLITDGANFPKIKEIWDKLPELNIVAVTDGAKSDRVIDFSKLIDGSTEFEPAKTRANDPALKT